MLLIDLIDYTILLLIQNDIVMLFHFVQIKRSSQI